MNQRVTRKNLFGAAAVAGAALTATLTVSGAAHAQGQVLSPNGVPVPSTFYHKAPAGMFPQTPRGFFPQSRQQSAVPRVQPNFQGPPVLPRGYLVPQGYTYFITPQGITAFPQYYPYATGGYYFIRPAP